MRSLLFTAILFSFCITSFAQDPISEKMKWYELAQSNTNLFVHFDKNVYTNNETVWFTGYLLKQNPITFNKHRILAISLIREVDSTLVAQDKFMIQNGISFGSLRIPDSLITGSYKLIAHTDALLNNKPEAVFVQYITIKTKLEPPFKASMKLLKAADINTPTNQILLSVTSNEGSFLPKPINVNYKFDDQYKQTKTDVSGQLIINLLPKKDLSDPHLYVKLDNQKDTSFIQIPIPQAKTKAIVKFYPEGGNLITGLSATIGWEVTDQYKMSLPTTAFLYKNSEVIDTIETNSYGMGKFKLVPEENITYSVKLNHNGIIDSSYALPKAIDKGIVMELAHAVVQDTLTIGLKSNSTQQFFIRIHNFKESFVYAPFDMQFNKRIIKIPLNEVPKGLATLTITDSLERPLAERMFFAHYSANEKIKLGTDQSTYKPREKVTLELTLPQADEQAVVSIACVQDNRLMALNMTDIESYHYLSSELSALPPSTIGRPISNTSYLENILLIKGWRRYKWQDLHATVPKDTLLALDRLTFSGQVTKNKKTLTDSLTVATLNSLQISLIPTTNKGSFRVNNEDLLTAAENKLFLFVNRKNSSLYEIIFNDPYPHAAKSLLNELSALKPRRLSSFTDNSELSIRFDEKAIKLNEVNITAKIDNNFNYGKRLGANACGDYVCKFNILNCMNHGGDSENTQPVVGKLYPTNGRINMIYTECKDIQNGAQFVTPINGIHLAKEFYLNDYAEPQEPAFFSTIYWNYETVLNGLGPTKLSFHTSDITGKFRIVVQGITSNDVIYAEHFFEVKK